jgi:hypothetical protein
VVEGIEGNNRSLTESAPLRYIDEMKRYLV